MPAISSSSESRLRRSAYLERDQFPRLLSALTARGFQIVGPTVVDEAIVFDEIRSVADLPIGWTDEQDAGRYRLKPRADGAFFGYAVGPHSWKKFLFPPQVRLWAARRENNAFAVKGEPQPAPKFAFLGVRACDLAAIGIQDRVFMGGAFTDPIYKARREEAFIIALHCGTAGGTCFCVSMKTGPKARNGFDLALTEVLIDARHFFVVESGSAAGAELLGELAIREATQTEIDAAESVVAHTAARMGRSMEASGVKELLYANMDHPRWDEVASRCLTCANCTMVCPTCFCSSVEDTTDLTGDHAERWRRWDSCFTVDFTHIVGGSVRGSGKSRYRQWLTHKVATWHDQFGTSGCVGCGRCITWCPVGIDITEEVRAIRETDARTASIAEGNRS
jgi:ferredoxin